MSSYVGDPSCPPFFVFIFKLYFFREIFVSMIMSLSLSNVAVPISVRNLEVGVKKITQPGYKPRLQAQPDKAPFVHK